MKRRIPMLPIGISLVFLIAIFHAPVVVAGAKDAIDLCLYVIIPSIFPFLFLSMLLCNYWSNIELPIMRPICRLVGIPEEEQSILLFALIGGYPVGAQVVAQAYHSGRISKRTAARLIGFCNNAGPSFVFGLMGVIFGGILIPAL